MNFITFVTKCYYTCDLYYICDQLLHLCLQQSSFLQLYICKKAGFLHKKAAFLQLYNCKKAAFLQKYIFVKKQLFYVKKQLFYKKYICKKAGFLHKKAAFLQKIYL